ncbi:MAG: hypothetical protein ABUS48_02440 [Pseudomonadota bacterium]
MRRVGAKLGLCGLLLAVALAAPAAMAQSTTTATSAAAPANAQTQPMPIYNNTLAPGWDNWSWAQVTLSFTIGDPSETPIKVETPAGWQALYLHHAPFGTAGYSMLSFFIHGGAHGGQTLSVIAVDAQGHPFGDHFFRVTPTAQAWTEVDVPLSELGAQNQTVSGFWIQDGTAQPTTRYYVNQIVLR